MNDITFEQAWNYGGLLMWVLAALSVAALAVVFYLWIAQMSWIFLPSALKRLETAKDREAEGRRIAARLHAAVDWLADIAADVSAGAKPMVLAQGVSQAIVTTIFGLAVAIPCLVAYAFFRRRAQRRIAELETAVEEILSKK